MKKGPFCKYFNVREQMCKTRVNAHGSFAKLGFCKNFVIFAKIFVQTERVRRFSQEFSRKLVAKVRYKGVGPSTTLAWPGWKQPDIPVATRN